VPARLVAERLQVLLRRTVIVENRVGAGGRLAAQQLVNTPADQTVLMVGNPAVMSVAPLVYKDLKYDVQKDFVPVSALTDYDFGVAVGSALPVREVSHMLAWLRANPRRPMRRARHRQPAHFFVLMLSYMAASEGEVVGYRGSAPLLSDLIGGQVPMAFDTLDSLLPQHEGASCACWPPRAPSARRSRPMSPRSGSRACPCSHRLEHLFAPSTTPGPPVELLARTVQQIMSESDTRAKFTAAKMVPVAMTQAQTVAMLRAFDALWAPVIKRSGFKPES
jgi:tripartite-type tricarboxylate transporter receptor subunit TctC